MSMTRFFFMAVILFILVLKSLPAHSGQERGGGSIVALEFKNYFTTAYGNLSQKMPELFKKVSSADLQAVMDETLVLVVDSELEVIRDGVKQKSVAVNDRGRRLILVNGARWQAVTNSHLREAIALHEVLSLAGLESTGDYSLSSAYLEFFGEKADPLKNPDWAIEQERKLQARREVDLKLVRRHLKELRGFTPDDDEDILGRSANFHSLQLMYWNLGYRLDEKTYDRYRAAHPCYAWTSTEWRKGLSVRCIARAITETKTSIRARKR